MGSQQSIENQDQTELNIMKKSSISKFYSKDDNDIKICEKNNIYPDYVTEKKFIVVLDNEPTYYLEKKPDRTNLLKMAKKMFKERSDPEQSSQRSDPQDYTLEYIYDNDTNKLCVYGTYKWYLISY